MTRNMKDVTRDIEDAAIRLLDRQRLKTRRVILLSFVVAALLAWALVGFGYLLVWGLR